MTAERAPFHPRLIAAGAVLGGFAVILGAFGAHALKGRFGADEMRWWETAVQFEMWIAVAVMALGIGGDQWMKLPAWLLASGTLVFSGSLYAMALGAPRWLGAITPLGGLLMIAGWALLAWRAGSKGRSLSN